MLGAFLPPLAAMLLALLLRLFVTGNVLSASARALASFDPERWRLGLDYVSSFFLCSGAGSLVIFPLWYLGRGQLSRTGRIALALAGLWALYLTLMGGDGLPFWVAFAPVVPLFFLAVQEAMIIAMDSRRRGLGAATWVLFALSVGGSGLVSRVPADMLGLRVSDLQEAWMQPTDALQAAYGRMHGRLGLMQEIEDVEQMRALAVFLRDRLDVGRSILTPWPGSVGYISRQKVIDLLGRASPPADGTRPRSWYGEPQIDLAATLGSDADYIVPFERSYTVPPRVGEFLRRWIERYEAKPDASASFSECMAHLRSYELISVPIPRRSYVQGVAKLRPFYMLRKKALGLGPRLELRFAGNRSVDVLVWHAGHDQVVDLEVVLQRADGKEEHLRPTGEFVEQALVHARSALLLTETGERAIRLMRFRLPEDARDGEIRAILQNPNTGEDPAFAMVSRQATLKLRR
jgi:hypothetical protein